MIRWVRERAKYSEGESSGLDVTFTKCVDVKRGIGYLSHLGKRDHVLMSMDVMGVKD